VQADELARLNLPAGQGRQDAGALAKWPAGQVVTVKAHQEAPPVLYAPAAHREQEGAPPALNEPAGHARHALIETPALKLYVPASQLVQEDEPTLLQVPGPQDEQQVELVTQEVPNVPAVQLVQNDDGLVAVYLPKAQGEQEVAPPVLNVP
jgi:hypothetical protein